MSRRVLPPLRAWSGALLVCALLFCLAGLARPAMAMPSMGPMASMEMAAAAAAGGDSSGLMRAGAVGQATAIKAAAGSGQYGQHCPMAEQQCAAPKATLAHTVQPGPAPASAPTGTACSAAAVLTARPNAPPPALSPPDLHRLCVSRT
ncbi:hypothetical protein ABZ302_29355 [Streptomyces sp. NPDC006237]|uniref:hypothetical protein n=1 Tax=Streptomyces sp. NPDC006237 TaxID=3154474 RepID=UPI0033AD90DC